MSNKLEELRANLRYIKWNAEALLRDSETLLGLDDKELKEVDFSTIEEVLERITTAEEHLSDQVLKDTLFPEDMEGEDD